MSRDSEIKEVGVRLFYERGYLGTSLKDIANELSLRAPSLYNHIESKQKLLQDIMFGGIDSLTEEFDSAVEGVDDVLEMIRRASEAHIGHHVRDRIQAHVNTYEIHSLKEPARTELLRRRRAYAKRWEAMITRGVEEGVCFTDAPKLAAFSIIDLGAGVARWYRPDGTLSEAEIISYYGNVALAIVGAKRANGRPHKKAAASVVAAVDRPDPVAAFGDRV